MPLPLPFLEMGSDLASQYGLPVGRYVLIDAVSVLAEEWGSDDLRLLWEIVGNAEPEDWATYSS